MTPISPPARMAIHKHMAYKNSQLKILDYYLTFIHYFGFSINPRDGTSAPHLSIRMDRKASPSVELRLAPHSEGNDCSSLKPSAVCKESPEPAGALFSRPTWPLRSVQLIRRKLGWRLLRSAVKFIAISLTTFLTLNHITVLFHYIYDGEKVFTELLLELRLVITKLSALIFVISWHRNRRLVRQLIRLVKSTSLYILSEPDGQEWEARGPTGRRATTEELEQMNLNAHPKRLQKLNWRIVKWWVLCTSVTIIHFSLSEAEIRTAQHLWQWLEDYSLHQLNNQTTSISTLFIMASFDNYIYTVHVYGTRLIGASIICIVCTFQMESIFHLDEQALASLRATSTAPLGQKAKGAGPLNRRLFFVLGESDWIQVEHNRYHSPPIGWLSSVVGRKFPPKWLAQNFKRLCGLALAAIGLSRVEARESKGKESGAQVMSVRLISDQLVRANQAAANLSQPGKRPSGCGAAPIQRDELEQPEFPRPELLAEGWNVGAAFVLDELKRASRVEARQRYLLELHLAKRQRGLAWPQLSEQFGATAKLATHHDHQSLARPGNQWLESQPAADTRDQLCDLAEHRSRQNRALGQQLDLKLDSLARKYELIRTVNSRVDKCFGHILLSQYSFLFLMSCIDVVYFSLSFNPKTKTKCIIISGMILLWLPYLLLYKYASDIGLASRKLQTSVRRLARLTLVLQLSASELAEGRQHNASKPILLPNRLGLPTMRRHRLSSIATKVAALDGDNVGPHTRARIFNKLDHVFEPSHLSIVGILRLDKFFLLNFAKIVITASVMAIQFISRG